ncbi:hypothetical protein KEJ39_03940 [Candidatus Bathyarchaeota archaeon]|nr:hypothetical protein [Candidatus Bathyarchaeota archaeon]
MPLTGGGDTQTITTYLATDLTLTATSETEITQMTTNITTGNSPVLIIFTAGIVHDVAGKNIFFRLKIDGTQKESCGGSTSWVYGEHAIALHRLEVFSAGSHTIKIYYQIDSGGSAKCRPAGYPLLEHMRLTIIEFKS